MGAKGRLIVFEGVDAAGKTTLCDHLCNDLHEKALPAQRYHFPGKVAGTLGELVYRIHHHHDDEFFIPTLTPCSLQILHIAAHVDMIESSIKKSVTDGMWVVLDRFWWSTYVYGRDSGVSATALDLMIRLEKETWGDLLPNNLFLIDSASPLRDDEIDCSAWHRKRQIYTELLESERNLYPCAVIETANGDTARERASKQILHDVLG